MIFDADPVASPTTRQEALVVMGAWVSALSAVAAGLAHSLGVLQPPEVWSGTDAWDRWASRHEPDELVAAIVTPVALVLVCTLAVVTVGAGAAVAVATRRGKLPASSDQWPAVVTAFIATVSLLSGGPAAASTGSGASAGDDVATRPVVELVRRPATTVSTTTTTAQATTTTSLESTPTSVATPAPTPTTPDTAPPAAVPTPEQADPATVPGQPDPSTTPTVKVRPGDNLWRIAERQVTAAPQRGPILRYWLRLIDANASRLVEPGNPSLIHPGQILDLPGE
jgi:hypothetical protein